MGEYLSRAEVLDLLGRGLMAGWLVANFVCCVPGEVRVGVRVCFRRRGRQADAREFEKCQGVGRKQRWKSCADTMKNEMEGISVLRDFAFHHIGTYFSITMSVPRKEKCA